MVFATLSRVEVFHQDASIAGAADLRTAGADQNVPVPLGSAARGNPVICRDALFGLAGQILVFFTSHLNADDWQLVIGIGPPLEGLRTEFGTMNSPEHDRAHENEQRCAQQAKKGPAGDGKPAG